MLFSLRTRLLLTLALISSGAILLTLAPAYGSREASDYVTGAAEPGPAARSFVGPDSPDASVRVSRVGPRGARSVTAVGGVAGRDTGSKARVGGARRRAVPIPGGVPAALAGAERVKESLRDDNSPLTLTVVLKRDDQQGFEAFLRDVQDMRSPTFRRYLSPREQARRFGPGPKAYREVRAWLRRKGFGAVEGSENRITLTVRGPRELAEEVFGVRIGQYRIGGMTFYANDSDPVVPEQLASRVQAVVGLSTLAQPRANGFLEDIQKALLKAFGKTPCEIEAQLALNNCTDVTKCDGIYEKTYKECIARNPAGAKGGGNGPGGGSGSSGLAPTSGVNSAGARTSRATLAPAVRGTSGGAPEGTAAATRWAEVDGTGQKIGLLQFDTFDVNDIRDYLALAGLPAAYVDRLSQVHVNGGAARGPNESEVLMDIIAVLVNAPGADVVVYDAPFTDTKTTFQTIFNRMIGDGVTVIGNSWAYCEDQTTLADVESLDSVLASAAAAGISVFNATGDTGSTCLNGSPNTITVPANSPHATAVGGTSLTLGPALTYGSETHWSPLNSPFPTGEGGYGVSRFFTRPAYQDGFNTSPMRSIPDVSVNADPANGIRICQKSAGGCPTDLLYGGTSLAAPLWAAFGALLNQAQGRNLGNLNPLLYPLGNTDAFHSPASMGSDFRRVGLGSPNLNLIHLALGQGVGAPLAEAAAVGPVSPGVSRVEVTPERVAAEDSSASFVVVRLRDADGNSISGKTVTLTADPSAGVTVTPPQGVSNVANGAVVFSVKSTRAGAVTLTATDVTDGIVLSSRPAATFITPPAASGGITASPTTVNANGSDATNITVTLVDSKGDPSPGKVVNLSQGNGSSIISATTAQTDATGKVQFTARNNVAQTVTYTAVDVTDGNLPVPGSATVNFVNASGFCAGFGAFKFGTAAPDYSVTTFASSFPVDCFEGRGPFGVAFDAEGTLYVGDYHNNNVYAFGPEGGVAGPATLVGTVPPSFGVNLTGMTFTMDGRLYANVANGNKLLELNPADASVKRVVAEFGSRPNALALAQDPLSGDLFVTNFDSILRVSNFANGPATVSTYLSGGFIDGIVFAPDGTLYLAAADRVFRVTGTNAPNPAVATAIAFLPHGDGIAIEPNPAHPSKPILYVNRTDGVITRIDTSALPDTPTNPCGAACTDIYTGGSRGDFVTVSPAGCLYATQSDRVLKVTKADGSCSLTPESLSPQIALTPEDVQPQPSQGTAVTFTAQLRNVADPANVPVTLFISGANARASLVRTDSTGKAVFTYTGVSTGVDEVFATAEVGGSKLSSNDAKVTWTPGKHSTYLTLNQSPGAGDPNKPLTLTATLVDISASPVAGVAGAMLNFSLAGRTCAATTDAAGRASCSLTPGVAAGSYVLAVAFDGTSGLLPNSASRRVELIQTPAALPAVRFSSAAYQVGEGAGRVAVTINRLGDPASAVSVDYQTADLDTFTFGCADAAGAGGAAFARCDFATAVGTLTFAAGETSKTVTVPVIDDVYVEGDETFRIALSNAAGATAGPAATVTIKDNDTAAGAPNPVFSGDFFVRQHYLDFLSREPEPDGLAAWLRVLNNCPDVHNLDPNSPSAQCDRILVSKSFFESPEFSLKGFYAFRFYMLAFARLPEYLEIVADMSFVAGATPEEVFQRKAQLATNISLRQEFQTAYGGLSNAAYVNALLGRYGLTQITTPDPADPDGSVKVTLTGTDLIGRLDGNTLTRAQVLRAVADSDQVNVAEFNNAFVAMQYYGYLRRKPEPTGFEAWLRVVLSGDRRTMVNGFLNSAEYRLRFGSPSQ